VTSTGSPARRILLAPDSFKGSFLAAEVASAMGSGIREAGAVPDALPIGDGGEGTMDALVAALGGEYRAAIVSDPLGRPVRARYAVLLEGEAIVEAAEASGLARLSVDERDAWRASTRGTGELIAAAAAAGAQEVLVTVGGSATTDGGAGALEALDEAEARPRLRVLCDVRTPWEDCARVFGPQKGADPATVARLERRLDELARRAPRDPRGVPMTGCAGGLSGGLWAFRGAALLPGAAFVLDAVEFDERVRRADLVLTGEGSLDEQTLSGKAVAEVAARCARLRVPCHAIVGRARLAPERLRLCGVTEASSLAELRRAAAAVAQSRCSYATSVRNSTKSSANATRSKSSRESSGRPSE
jgi:glycerate 2-kinase